MPDVARMLLGDPTSIENSGKNWRYGRGRSLSLHVEGSLAGTWSDWKSGEHGNVLELIEKVLNCNRSEALDWVRGKGVIPANGKQSSRPVEPQTNRQEPPRLWLKTDRNRPGTAAGDRPRVLWKLSVCADEIPVPRAYLAGRCCWPGIDVPNSPPLPAAVRWVFCKAARQVEQPLPIGAVGALVYRFDTATGELAGVQLEALDANARRLLFFGTAKRLTAKGSRLAGSFLRLPPRTAHDTRLLVLVEGPLDALAATWRWSGAEVWCCCGTLRKPDAKLDGYTVRIEADGDGPGRTAAAKVRDALEFNGVSVVVNWRTKGDLAEEWADMVCYPRLERAALMETDGGLTREMAEVEAAETWPPSRLWPPWFGR